MHALNRLPLLWKVLVAPVLAVLCFLGFVGYAYLVSARNTAEIDRVNEVLFPALTAATDDAALLSQITDLLSSAAEAKTAAQVEEADTLGRKLADSLADIGRRDASLADETAQLAAEFDAYFKASAAVVTALIADQMPPPGSMQGVAAKLDAYRKHAEAFRAARLATYSNALQDVSRASRAAALKGAVIGLLVLLLLPAIVFQMSRMIVAPVRRATEVANAIARGDLGAAIDGGGVDEVGQLMQSMRSMQDGLKCIVAAEVEMTRRHEAGDIDYRIDAMLFPGIYGEMAQGVNTLAASHIALSQRVVEVVQHYGRGDFSLDLEALPGKLSEITEAVAGVKTSFQSINAQVLVMVEAAARGDFAVRADEGACSHSFRQIMAGLNRLMAVCDTNLKEVGERLGEIANGDLEKRAAGQQQGSFADLMRDVDRTIDGLLAIVGGIRRVTATISTAADDIAGESAELSRRSEQEAGRIDEIARSIERLNLIVSQNAEHARQANQLAVNASDVARRGGERFGEVVQTMHAIKGRSKEIVDIITLIDGIAFQTNILALNAAVEAARAGDHGRGFAVVATEVRNLSQRSAAAAREINTLIRETAQSVDIGTGIVDSASSTMTEIVASAERVNAIMAEITAATVEQADGIEQVSAAVSQMDESTRRNAAAVETTAQAAHSLQQQAKALVDSVGGFKTREMPAGGTARGASPRLRAVGAA